jgi:hypothetical protein
MVKSVHDLRAQILHGFLGVIRLQWFVDIFVWFEEAGVEAKEIIHHLTKRKRVASNFYKKNIGSKIG